ncbi:MAG TPA: histidine--tRNA ligase [Rhodospirillaceae bacterium]|nr:histidine--tRNA ligase [Rhodospirillaceae bacterium]|tara:strand:+ start:569 stop:1813 length:1245 start_codon:yes stop_codon:yes gene_type:complete
MASLQPVRGTHDLLPEEARRARHVSDTGRIIAERYGYEEAATPIFEFSDVFARTLGETSDIVTKEMYTFTDKGGDSITLRPEGTAGIARALISGGLSQNLPLKFFYAGPMFRYERPQKGRLRQFHQIGAELLGVADPIGDVEVIALGAAILDALDVQGNITLELNTLGNTQSRADYRDALVTYFNDHRSGLSSDSRDRLERNPLRILDSKNEGDRQIVSGAPEFDDSLDTESRDFFAEVCAGLDALSISWMRNSRLVRGLDYYCHTAFEFTTNALGAQRAVLAGGRYDGLVEQMGGPSTPGVGWASGIERLSMLVGDGPAKTRPIAIIPLGDAAEEIVLILTNRLRRAGISVDLGYRGKMKQRMKRANNIGARAAVIIGEDELEQSSATIRDLDSGEQHRVPLDDLQSRLEQFL